MRKRQPREPEEGAPELTPREREVVRQVQLGLRNAEIAARLLISEETVKKHLNTIFHKLDVRSRVALALHAPWLTPEDMTGNTPPGRPPRTRPTPSRTHAKP